MASPSASRVVVLLVGLALLVAGCGGGDEQGDDTSETTASSTEPRTAEPTATTTGVLEPVLLPLTFDGESCTYEGPPEIPPGTAELVFVNESEGRAAVNMVIVDDGYTIQDVIDDLGPEPSTGHHPPWTRELPGVWRPIAAGESHNWEGDLDPGLYAAVCAQTSPLGVWFGFGLTVGVDPG